MPAYLLTWNPKEWDDNGYLSQKAALFKRGKRVRFRWSTGATKRIAKGDRLFFLRLGEEPRGIFASAKATSDSFQDDHFRPGVRHKANYVKLEIDALLAPGTDAPLPIHDLETEIPPAKIWRPMASGTQIKNPKDLRKLENLWAQHLRDAAHAKADGIGAGKSATIPSAGAYESALRKIRVSENEKRMLLAHYYTMDHTATAGELATAMKWPNFNSWNLRYGKLAKKLCGTLGVHQNQFVNVIASFDHPNDGTNRDCRFTMRPEVVKAVEQLGWVSDTGRGTEPERPEADPEALSFREGESRRGFVLHRKREWKLRILKIATALKSGKGRLQCEVPGCGFDFAEVYGELGREFAEVHHLKGLANANAGNKTIGDLAIVCANCHRMIHRNGKCRSINGLIKRTSRK